MILLVLMIPVNTVGTSIESLKYLAKCDVCILFNIVWHIKVELCVRSQL